MTNAAQEQREAKVELESIHGRIGADWFPTYADYSRVINAVEGALSAWDDALREEPHQD